MRSAMKPVTVSTTLSFTRKSALSGNRRAVVTSQWNVSLRTFWLWSPAARKYLLKGSTSAVSSLGPSTRNNMTRRALAMAVSDPRQKRLEVLIGVVVRIEEGGIDLDAVGWLVYSLVLPAEV